MKKVLVMAAAAMLFAAPALAAIQNSAHDLSNANGGSNITEICVFCHTPHGADLTVTDAPLWNRTTVTGLSAVYNSPTLDAAPTVASVEATDAPLCLSCHDGASIGDALQNPPNTLTAVMNITATVGTAADLGLDLSDDHPIGFDYTTVAAADGGTDAEIDSKANVEGTAGMTGALSYGGGDDMWCSSCHDVHGITGVSTFLRIANTNSDLCLTCHIK